MTKLLYDLRYALRQLRKAPGFSLTAICTLALGIGISAAMFTVVDGVLLRPLPVPYSSQIVAVGEANNSGGISSSALPNLRDWRTQSRLFQDIAWFTENFFDLKKADGSTQFSINVEASSNFFSMLQAQPLLGRTFLPNEGNGGNAHAAVLSYYVWQNNFHGDKDILGKTIQLGQNSYSVVGVMPQYFYIGIPNDGPVVWTILAHTPDMEDRSNGFLFGMGRLRPGVTIAAAKAELTGIQANIAKQYGSEHLPKDVAIVDYRDSLVGSVRRGMLALQGAVLLVWLIACANIAGLMLTRMTARRREIAVRAALGAPRGRIIQQFLTESLLLGLCGGLVGLGVAVGSLALLRHSLDASLNRSGDIALNGHVILLLIVLSIVSAVIFGTAPALEAASADPQAALHAGSRGVGTGRQQLRLRNALIIGELALSLILLVSAGLLLRTLYALQQVPLGFNPQKLVIAQFFSKAGFVPTAQDQNAPDIRETIFKPLLERVQHLPGVESAALVTATPLSTMVQMNDTFAVIGNPSANEANRTAQIHAVTPEVYHTLQIRLLQGRLFGEQDHMGTPASVIVNEAFAHQYLGAKPIGKRLNLDLGASSKSVLKDATVVGVVENTPQNAIGRPAEPEVDVDMYQVPVGDDFYPIFSLVMQLVVRTQQKPDAFIPEITRILTQVSTAFVVSNVQTMQQKIEGLLGSQTLAARLLWIFAIAALLIAAAGLYGLLSYSVSQRTRDIGVQIALGAQRGDILKLIMKQAFRLLGVGIALGIFGAYFATRIVRSFLYGVDQHDLITIAGVSILLATVGILASYIPARRAANIEPIEALRAE
ncbi:MAG TPA: ABC transporter permease [Acidobacteriaceae bacterium]|jgi:predicted permease|nr:ABC transporter permease [Acidobacteriaceae bacterium]